MSTGYTTPTKMALMELREKLRLMRFAKQILEQKRDSLREVLKSSINLLVDVISFIKRGLLESIEFFYASFVKYRHVIDVYQTLARDKIEVDVKLVSKGGYCAPEFRINRRPSMVEYPEGIRAMVRKFQEILPDLLKLASILTEFLILLHEIEVTNRIVNTLEKIAIPTLEERVRYIRMMLSEMQISELSALRAIFIEKGV